MKITQVQGGGYSNGCKTGRNQTLRKLGGKFGTPPNLINGKKKNYIGSSEKEGGRGLVVLGLTECQTYWGL